MLERFIRKPLTLQSLGACPLGPYLDSFAGSLQDLGYATSTARSQLQLLVDFGRWLIEGKVRVADLDGKVVDLFADERRHQGRLRRGQFHTLCRFLEHVRTQGIIPPAQVSLQKSPLAELECRYESYLRVERGLTGATVENYRPFVYRFVVDRFGDGPIFLKELGPSDISRFVLRHAYAASPGRAKLMVTALRSFLRFLLQRGEIDVDLAVSVPPVADWRLSSVPKYLEFGEVEQLLATCDRSRPTGRRDYAILLLLARLGLRAGEVVALELDDIDWRASELMVRGKGLVHQRVPLLADVGEALAAYLRQDRPSCNTRRVFIQMKAPRRGFAGPSTVDTIVRRALERADLHPPLKGAHLLRHSLATGMLRRGASMAEIGQVLRHRAPATTEIYAKVDIGGLRSLAQPWPENRGEQ